MNMEAKPQPEQSLQEERIRTALNRHWQASTAGEANAEHDIYDAAVICDYPQSGERILGRSNLQALRSHYPGKPSGFKVKRILDLTGLDDIFCQRPQNRFLLKANAEAHGQAQYPLEMRRIRPLFSATIPCRESARESPRMRPWRFHGRNALTCLAASYPSARFLTGGATRSAINVHNARISVSMLAPSSALRYLSRSSTRITVHG